MLEGRRVLVTGVLTERSIATSVAPLALEEGAEVVVTSFGRGRRIAERTVGRWGRDVPVLELDVTDQAHHQAVVDTVRSRWGGLDALLHSVAFAPPSCLGTGVVHTPWEDVSTAIEVSVHSMATLAGSLTPMFEPGASIVGLTFNARQAWPGYDWMGVAKAGLESLTRYLAVDLGPSGVRVNLVSAGPLGTMAARSVPSYRRFEHIWDRRAPLGWDPDDALPVARACVALMSDWFPATTGSVVEVDGGVHAVAIDASVEPIREVVP